MALLSAVKLLLPWVKQVTALSLVGCGLDVSAAFQVGSVFAVAPQSMRDLTEVDLSNNPLMGDRGAKAALWPMLRHVSGCNLWQVCLNGCGMTVASAALLASVLHTARPRSLGVGDLVAASRSDVCTALATAIVATDEGGGAGDGGMKFLGHDALQVQQQCVGTVTASSHSALVYRRLEDWATLYGSMLLSGRL